VLLEGPDGCGATRADTTRLPVTDYIWKATSVATVMDHQKELGHTIFARRRIYAEFATIV